MPKVKNDPKELKPYLFHGVDLSWDEGDKWAKGDCPMCGREGKFAVKIESGIYKCLICAETSNAIGFLRWLWEESQEAVLDRPGINAKTYQAWGVRKSLLTGHWLIPGYDQQLRLRTLYRYGKVAAGGRLALLPTPTMGHFLLGSPDNFTGAERTIDICEGPWDGMLWWQEVATIDLRAVWSVATCTTYSKNFNELFAGKEVNILFDNDHPRTHPRNGKEIEPAGLGGMRRMVKLLAESDRPPRSINIIDWSRLG